MKSVNVNTAVVGEVEFPKGLEIEKVSKSLLAQAVRVYQAAQRQGNANTKTRGEVAGSTRKLYKQKGTGRARHGSIKAPVFIGGGTVFGPRKHDFDLEMPVSMRRAATVHALNAKKEHLFGIEGLDKVKSETKNVVKAIKALLDGERRVLVVLSDADKSDFRKAVRNISYVVTVPADELNAYDVMKYKNVVVEDEAWKVLEDRLVKSSK